MSRCIFFLAVFLSSFFAFADAVQKPPEFVVVIPSYNNGRNNSNKCLQNLASVIAQTYPHYSVIYVDDCSTDDTATLVDLFIHRYDVENKFQVIHNKENKGALRNLYEAIYSVDENKIIVTLDGDDAFAHNKVLEYLAKIYAEKNIWITFGNYVIVPNLQVGSRDPVPQTVIQNNLWRQYGYNWLPPRTFYAKLFRQIKIEDLLQRDGNFYSVNSDRAIMGPMLAMASEGHFKKISEVLYIYYVNTPINDFRIRGDLQRKIALEMRAKPPYHPLKTLFPEVTR
jgi:glycosyltransferase involved in cell wall biosynthesis